MTLAVCISDVACLVCIPHEAQEVDDVIRHADLSMHCMLRPGVFRIS